LTDLNLARNDISVIGNATLSIHLNKKREGKMKADEKMSNKSLWAEIEDNQAETISGGRGHKSGFEGASSFVKNTIVIFQTNIVNVIGNISGNLTINQGNSSGINQGSRHKNRG
jgi:hypothetical protein